MLTVTLVATFAAAAMWQQWRAVEVETAERGRVQSTWILIGALDWSRLILREDGRSGGADHLAEPWAVPLEEARLSTFLAAENNVSQVDDASTDTTEAFLSGQITDMQGRLNITNLAEGGQVQAVALRQFTRLFERLGLPPQQLTRLLDGLRRAQAGGWPFSSSISAALEGVALGAPPEAVASAIYYASVAGVLAAAMKLLRIGQNASQSLLTEALAEAPRLIAASQQVAREDMGWFNPWLDIASARHEHAEARLFIS